MPLPTGGGDWPPLDTKPYIDQSKAAMAWWSGKHDDLKSTSSAGGTTGRRKFWQRRNISEAATQQNNIHVPLAADIASVSADLLFGDGFGLLTDDKAAQAQLEVLEEEIGIVNLLAEAGEWASASGGVYLRAAWDQAVADHPLSEAIPQSQAVPDFRFNVLTAVTLWKDVFKVNSDVWRLLERHEKGRVLSGLYVGSESDLGDPVPLKSLPQTEAIPEELILGGRLTDRLLVEYFPNVRPNRPLPQKPLGRPDWLGSEDLLDGLDEIWTLLMRDIRLAAAHVIVPQEWLRLIGNKPGSAATLDMDGEVFTAFDIPEEPGKAYVPSVLQPEIRVEQHLAAALATIERITSAAGYSPQTFGLNIEGRAESGTALRVREGKTDSTVGKKQRYAQPRIRRHAQTLLDIGAEVFGSPTVADVEKNPVKVKWPELEQDPSDKATFIKNLRDAQAISIRTAVMMAQPELDEKAVDDEVELIEDEGSMGDPMNLGIVPPGGDEEDLDDEGNPKPKPPVDNQPPE